MKKTHVHTSLHSVYTRFPAWNIAVAINGSSCCSLGNLHHLTFFFFLSFSFQSSQSPGGVCGQLALPHWCGDFLALPSRGQTPLRAPHTWLEGLPDLDCAPWRLVFFLPRGTLVCLYPSVPSPSAGNGVRSLFQKVHMPSGTPDLHSVLAKCSKHTGAQDAMRIFIFHWEIRV